MIYVENLNGPSENLKGKGFYIGRGSELGNPYGTHPNSPIQVESRAEAIEKFESFLELKISQKDPSFCEKLNEIYRAAKIGDVTLLCYCSPLPCHGQIIKQIIENKINK